MTIARTNATAIRSVEKTAVIVIAALLAFRILFGTALDFYLLTGITLFAVYYLWFGFFLFTNAIPIDIIDKKKRAAFTPFIISSSILMGVVYSVSLISVLYAFFFYPRMQFMLSFSLVLLVMSFSLLFVYHRLNPGEQPYVSQFYRRSAIYGALIFILLAIPVETRLEVLYKKHPGFIQAYKEYRQEPERTETLEKLREERSKFR